MVSQQQTRDQRSLVGALRDSVSQPDWPIHDATDVSLIPALFYPLSQDLSKALCLTCLLVT